MAINPTEGLPFDAPEDAPHFDGETYEPPLDHARLAAQAIRVFVAMASGAWMTLEEIAEESGDPQASVSARLRDFRKPKFGGHTVHRRRVRQGLWQYRLERNAQHALELFLPADAADEVRAEERAART